MLTEKVAKVAKFYECKICDYITDRKSSYDKHKLTAKHLELTKVNEQLTEKVANLELHVCNICKKEYKSRTGLWKHKHKDLCSEIVNIQTETNLKHSKEEILGLKEIMKYLMKENSEMKIMMIEQQTNAIEQQNKMIEHQNMMMKVLENGTTNNSHNVTNSHNKAFNLNFFLNETCKDAMNIGEFVDSLKLQLPDLEKVGEKGYIEGISSIIVKNLKALDITKRPVHCTDKKRETCYIKDNDVWEKDENKTLMNKLVKKVVYKNANMFGKYREKHPDCIEYHSKYNDQYQKIVFESLGGKGDNEFEKNEKIIKNILKEVVIDKHL